MEYMDLHWKFRLRVFHVRATTRPMGAATGERFSTKDGVRDALIELATSPDVRNAPAQLVILLGKLADWVRQHRWTAAHWLEGDLCIELTPHAGGSLVSLSSDMGFGLNATVFPPVLCDEVPFADLEWIAENVPELASPLHTYRGRDRIHLELRRDDRDEVAEAAPAVPEPPETVRSVQLSALDPEATLAVPALTELLVAEMRTI
jgi:hypothetical protein